MLHSSPSSDIDGLSLQLDVKLNRIWSGIYVYVQSYQYKNIPHMAFVCNIIIQTRDGRKLSTSSTVSDDHISFPIHNVGKVSINEKQSRMKSVSMQQ